MRTMQLVRLILRFFFFEVPQGERIPPWSGIAWVDFYRNRAVAMPIPLNLIAGPLRAAWLWAKSGAWHIWHRDQGRVCQRCGWKS